jgi:hypothetical protein
MPDLWTQDRILALAPDSASASAAQGLTGPRNWGRLGADAADPRALWGECQGSGKTPYQVRVDLSEPAFKCSCPSRKFPCKHGLALLLLYARDSASFQPGAIPEWVSTWLDSRQERQQKKVEKATAEAAAPPGPEAKAKRLAQRESNITAGLDELETWLSDLVAQGFAAARARPASSWRTIAARMVDAQAPGLGRMLRDLEAASVGGGNGGGGAGGASGDGGGWQVAMLEQVGRIHTLVSAQRRIEMLPEDLRADVRSAVGVTTTKEEILARAEGEGRTHRDTWLIIARVVEQDDRLRVQRTWLWGAGCNRPALVLDFAVGAVGLDGSLALGTAIDAKLAYFPTAALDGARALVRQRFGTGGQPGETPAALPLPADPPGAADFDHALAPFADTLAHCPWRERTLLSVRAVRPVWAAGTLALIDGAGRTLPLACAFRDAAAWKLLAISGGHPVHLFAEWDGRCLLPLAVIAEGRFHDIGPKVEA